MRRRHIDQESEETLIDMTPMLDIVFIMLIFFIVTTSFVKESGISINSPAAASAVQADKGNIMVAIKPDGAIWIDRRVVDIRAVRANIEKLRAENPESAVVIQSDSDARTGVLVRVMDQIRMAGVDNISIAADQVP